MTIEDVEKIAEIAKLELTQEEKEKLLSDMAGILNYIKQIEEVDLSDEGGKAGGIEGNFNAWREDKIREEKDFSPDLIFNQFPDSKDNFVKVKKIL